MSRFVFRIEVEVERDSGKFASRDALSDEILEALEQADPGSMYVNDESEYSTLSWDVEDITDEENKRIKAERSMRAKMLHGEKVKP